MRAAVICSLIGRGIQETGGSAAPTQIKEKAAGQMNECVRASGTQKEKNNRPTREINKNMNGDLRGGKISLAETKI